MKPLSLFLLLCLAISCGSNKTSDAYSCRLEASETIKSFALSDDVRYNPFYLSVFSDDGGKEYLSFLNYRTNQILFYDLNSTDFLFKLDLYAEGPNGILQPTGLYVKDFDNIFVSSYAYTGLVKVDSTRRIVQKIPYGKTSSGYNVLPTYTPSSHPYNPPVFIGDKLYITQKAAAHFFPLAETPLTVAVDTVRKQCEALPLTFAALTEEALQANDNSFSREFNGTEFVYSFYVDEGIIVTPADHSEIKRIKVKSKYIDTPTAKQEDGEQGPKLNLELARYGDLVYDPYREVYYRFAYPKTTLEDGIRWWGKAVYGRIKFSVIILDKDFQVIGETLFPEAVYNSYAFFVHKDGLYISRDYQMIYDQSEDYMTFELFNLVKGE